MIVNAEVITTPDSPMILIREAMEKVDIPRELNRLIRVNGWGLSTVFRVSFISHDRERVLASGTFMVIEDREEYRTNDDNPAAPVSRAVPIRGYAQIGEWMVFEGQSQEAEEGAEMTVERNPKKGVWEIKFGEKVLAEEKTKEAAHARALEMRSGRAA